MRIICHRPLFFLFFATAAGPHLWRDLQPGFQPSLLQPETAHREAVDASSPHPSPRGRSDESCWAPYRGCAPARPYRARRHRPLLPSPLECGAMRSTYCRPTHSVLATHASVLSFCTALSLENSTKVSTPQLTAACAARQAPKILLLITSMGLRSIYLTLSSLLTPHYYVFLSPRYSQLSPIPSHTHLFDQTAKIAKGVNFETG